MGSSWEDQLIALAINLLAHFLVSVSARMWKCMEKRISQPATGGEDEVHIVIVNGDGGGEDEVHIVPVNGDGGRIAPRGEDEVHIVPVNGDGGVEHSDSLAGDYDHHAGILERPEDPAGLQSSTVPSSSRQSQDRLI